LPPPPPSKPAFGYFIFVIKICILYQVLVILMLRIVSLVKFGPGVTNPF
jgi:hypothetical protein